MRVLVGTAVTAMLGAASLAHAQSNNNYPFLRPQNGAQVPSGWPPGSGNTQARPPAYNTTQPFTAPGTFAPFQGGSRGNDRGIVGQPDTGLEQPNADTSEPLTGTPYRNLTKKAKPSSGDEKPGAGQEGPDQEARSQSNMGRQPNVPQAEEVIPKVIRLPKDPQERSNLVFDLFHKSREVKPPKQADVQLAVGSRLPSSWVYMDVPETVTRALPSYVGYVYTEVNGRYVVCDPATYKVIAIYGSVPS